MEQQKKNYTGRFSDGPSNPEKGETAVSRTRSPQQRRPSGFAAAGQTPKRSAPKPAETQKPGRKHREKKPKASKEKTKRTGGKKFSLMKILTGVLIVVLIALILIVIFGDRGTYHQMPTITRQEAEGSFAPEETPLPGVEEAI